MPLSPQKAKFMEEKCINLPNTRFSLYLCLDKIQYPYEQYGENEACFGKKIEIFYTIRYWKTICYDDVRYSSQVIISV